jgi:hypothetical protein
VILNYTTTVPVKRTVAEVQDMLGRAGAGTVATTYEDGKPSGVSFVLDTPAGRVGFVLPVRVDAVQHVLNGPGYAARYQKREHAERVAWRIAKDWLEAQLALVEAGMAELAEVMLPYQVTGSGQTVYRVLADSAAARAALTAGA